MGTKIDYVAILKPLETILANEKLSAEDKNKMALEVIKAILENAGTDQ